MHKYPKTLNPCKAKPFRDLLLMKGIEGIENGSNRQDKI